MKTNPKLPRQTWARRDEKGSFFLMKLASRCYDVFGDRIQFRKITPQIERSRKNRMKFVEELAANYLQDLETLILNDPSQWFNFYPYWDK